MFSVPFSYLSALALWEDVWMTRTRGIENDTSLYRRIIDDRLTELSKRPVRTNTNEFMVHSIGE
jgi:hypothetical protein